jgi:hypothetical protein
MVNPPINIAFRLKHGRQKAIEQPLTASQQSQQSSLLSQQQPQPLSLIIQPSGIAPNTDKIVCVTPTQKISDSGLVIMVCLIIWIIEGTKITMKKKKAATTLEERLRHFSKEMLHLHTHLGHVQDEVGVVVLSTLCLVFLELICE